ncbi:MAG: polyprenyl synthetase family protein [Pseudomonadales bacterium]|jgi:geranylgeranyl diphosphate synthase type II|nr:polyprenyl synthetase family protein [Pseudomonadales bacterium]
MDTVRRIENSLMAAVASATGSDCPPRLASALAYAVFPGGARIRPQLCLAVALANGDPHPEVSSAAAAALELIHCGSLVHDDLPCFDDAALRRGKPSVHAAYGEPLALLVGDALIVLAFEYLARESAQVPERLAPLVAVLGRAVGGPRGIIAGQAWECEPSVDVRAYHDAKTGALFSGATVAGAVAAGVDPAPWHALGARLGEAYQVADDLRDATAESAVVGKPVRVDEALGRPSAVAELGVDGAARRLEDLVSGALDSIPDCVGRVHLLAAIRAQAERILEGSKAACAA